MRNMVLITMMATLEDSYPIKTASKYSQTKTILAKVVDVTNHDGGTLFTEHSVVQSKSIDLLKKLKMF